MTALPVPIEHAAMRAAIREWQRLPAARQRHWDGASAAAAIEEAVLPSLAIHGFARVRVLEAPGELQIRSLRRLVVALSEQLGFLVPQTHANNRTALIRDAGKDYGSVQTRGHQTNAELAFHSDRADLNLLLYVRGAVSGGGVSILSYDRAANALEQANPDSLKRLFGAFPFDLRGERIFPTPLWHERPILWRNENGLRGHYIRRFIDDSQRHSDCPRLREDGIRALDDFDAVLNSLRDSGAFLPAPGELLVLDNYRVMHARDRFVDGASGKGRLAIRTWVAPFHSERLPDYLLPIAGSIAAGAYRGGVGKGTRYLKLLGRIRRPENGLR